MSSGQTTFVVILFAAVVVWCVAIMAFSIAVRRRRMRGYNEGPGHPSVAVPHDPWRRFTAALAAPYARVEWRTSRGARRRHTPEQTWFGYASPLPPATVAGQLRRDWRVRKPSQAEERINHGINAVQDELHTTGDLPALAFDIGRYAQLVRQAAITGTIDLAFAHDASDELGDAARTAFGSWEEYAEAYAAGLRASRFRAEKPYLKAVAWLTGDAESPWRAEAWPLDVEQSRTSCWTP